MKDHNPNLQPWVLWCVEHKLSWLVKGLMILCYPVYCLNYYDLPWNDLKRDLKDVY